MALNIDLAPTLLALAGVPAPPEMDGRSLVPLLGDAGAVGREAFLMEFWRYFPENTPSYVGVRTNRYKYVEFERGRAPWLFDLAHDPGEHRNLYGTPEGVALSKKLAAALQKLLETRNTQ